MGVPDEKDKPFTYADYKNWPDEERWELVNGEAYAMSPAPGRNHQEVLGRLFRLFSDITDNGPCTTIIAPLDVRLAEQKSSPDELISTVVQPDLMVFCDPEKLDDKGASGAPDIALEVLSPSTSYKDQTVKLALYEKHGVREYWIVNSEAPWVMVYRLRAEGKYGKPDYYQREDEAVSTVLGSAVIPLKKIL